MYSIVILVLFIYRGIQTIRIKIKIYVFISDLKLPITNSLHYYYTIVIYIQYLSLPTTIIRYVSTTFQPTTSYSIIFIPYSYLIYP